LIADRTGIFRLVSSAMEALSVAPAPVAAPEKKILDLKDPLAAPAARASPAPAGKWAMKKKLAGGDGGYVLEDVPHLTDYLPQLPVRATASMVVVAVSVSRRGRLVLGVDCKVAGFFWCGFCEFS
jgi:hypothetical protein